MSNNQNSGTKKRVINNILLFVFFTFLYVVLYLLDGGKTLGSAFENLPFLDSKNESFWTIVTILFYIPAILISIVNEINAKKLEAAAKIAEDKAKIKEEKERKRKEEEEKERLEYIKFEKEHAKRIAEAKGREANLERKTVEDMIKFK